MLNQQILKKIPPFFFITISLICGISWHMFTRQLHLPIFVYYSICICAINGIITAYLIKKNYFILPALCITTFSIGVIISDHQEKKHFHVKQILSQQPFNAQGTVQNITAQPHLRTPYRITFNIVQIKNKKWSRINANIYIYIRSVKYIKVGDTLLLKNIVCNKITNDSFEHYLIKENVCGTLFADKLNFEIIHTPTFSINRWVSFKKKNILLSLQKKLSHKTFPLFSSLFLGNKTQCKKELEPTADQFKTWGISHYLARSGLHLIVFVLLWELILRIVPLAFWIKQLIMLLLSLLYFALSWPSLSFMRALHTFILYKWCILLKRQAHFIHLLTLVCLGTLILNPIQLFFLDFQLSFALTFALAYFNHSYRTKPTQKA